MRAERSAAASVLREIFLRRRGEQGRSGAAANYFRRAPPVFSVDKARGFYYN